MRMSVAKFRLCIVLAAIATQAAIAQPVGAQSPELKQSATVRSGEKTQITTHSRFDNQCRPSRVEIKIVNAPAHGTVNSEPKDMVVHEQNRLGQKQPAQCVGKTVRGVAIFYQSKAGFVGNDSFHYLRFNPGNAKDRFNADVSYTVTVK
jgi:hypothetical protein